MIARTFFCDRDRFADLLADRLPPDETEEITAHLEECTPCRQYLEALAGAGEDWTAAREALSDSDLAPLHQGERGNRTPEPVAGWGCAVG